jgi:ureidoglycolate hydrolase
MEQKTYPFKNLTREAFDPYGVILGHYQREDGYEIVASIDSTGWLWALKTFDNKRLDQIDSHPDTRESFEPVWGTALLVVALPDRPSEIEVFLLDQPVLLHERVWHGLIALSAQARVKITENRRVTGVPYPLGFELKPTLTSSRQE